MTDHGVLAAGNPWTILTPVALAPPADASIAAADRFATEDAEGRWRLTALLRVLGPAPDPTTARLLAHHGERELRALAVARGLALPAPVLDRLVERHGLDHDVIALLGLSRDPGRVPVLGAALADDAARGDAALALDEGGGRIRYAGAIARGERPAPLPAWTEFP